MTATGRAGSAPVLVQKYGGTSVSSAERRQQAIDHVRRAREAGYLVAIVVSAMGRRGDPYATDTLLDLLRADGGPVDKRDYDLIFSCGEIISATIMAHLLKRQGIPAVALSGAQAGVHTDANHSEAEVVDIDPGRLRRHLQRGEVAVVAGCQGVYAETDDTTTLGRGGSDTSGVALGAALGAAKVEIFTDVEGVARANPRVVPRAPFLQQISYAAMLEMARYGAGVVHPRAVQSGQVAGIPVVVRSTFSTAPGTVIADVQDEHPIVGVATLGPLQALALEAATLDPATLGEWERRRLIMSLADSERGARLLAVSAEKVHELRWAQGELGPAALELEGRQAWISLVGDGQALQERSSSGRDLLAARGISVAYHELTGSRLTYAVDAGDEVRAVQALYDGIVDPD